MEGVAVSVAVPPGQMLAELTVTVGAGLTDTVPLAVVEQPESVYVTLYVVVEAGFTVMLCVVAPPGDHK